jgi:hypothetical protein
MICERKSCSVFSEKKSFNFEKAVSRKARKGKSDHEPFTWKLLVSSSLSYLHFFASFASLRE